MSNLKISSRFLFAFSLFLLLSTSCSSTEDAPNTVGMKRIGEASAKETSLSGDSKESELLQETTTSSILPSVSTSISTTSVVGIALIPNTSSTPTTSTTLFVETPDKPFYAATAIHAMLEVFKKQTDSEANWLLSNPGPFQGDRVLLVRNIEENWIQVSMPIRPHGTTAWVKRDSVSITEHKAKVIVDKYTGLLEGWENGELLFKESFDSGSEEHPTPLGDFYINEINVESNEISGRKLVGINAFSTTIDPTSEGDPAIAFLARESNEGSEEPSTRGCIRVSKKVLDLITGLPLGTPVQIVG